ncbi:TRAP transporter small permease subunit [Azospirillum sp. ST 5-10]|uniref:TRAP transporter small permease subunit n=1 Tax=unclassified Azospirillum TaxID=2630922 RepID=UPI003F49DBBA
MDPLLRALRRVERLAAAAGCALLLALMLIITADVVLRYALHRPFEWTHDVVTLYLMPGIFFLLLSDSFRGGAQVRVDILRDGFSPRGRAWADALGNLCALGVFALIGCATLRRGVEALAGNDVVAGPIPWPMWPSVMIVPVGCAMLLVRLALSTAAGFRSPGPAPAFGQALAEGGVE